MAFDSTGVFTRVSNSFSNPVTGTTIDPTNADALFDDFETAFNNCLTKSTFARQTTDFTATATIVLSDTGLTVNLAAGKTYSWNAVLFTSSAGAGGIRVGFSQNNGLAISSGIAEAYAIHGNDIV